MTEDEYRHWRNEAIHCALNGWLGMSEVRKQWLRREALAAIEFVRASDVRMRVDGASRVKAAYTVYERFELYWDMRFGKSRYNRAYDQLAHCVLGPIQLEGYMPESALWRDGPDCYRARERRYSSKPNWGQGECHMTTYCLFDH
jgi:hypothetical protein